MQKSETTIDNNEQRNKNVQEDSGFPMFTKSEDMTRLIAKPSGNMVRMRCAAKGK